MPQWQILPPDAVYLVTLPHHAFHEAAQDGKYLVSCLMPIPVIDPFEVVDIEYD